MSHNTLKHGETSSWIAIFQMAVDSTRVPRFDAVAVEFSSEFNTVRRIRTGRIDKANSAGFDYNPDATPLKDSIPRKSPNLTVLRKRGA